MSGSQLPWVLIANKDPTQHVPTTVGYHAHCTGQLLLHSPSVSLCGLRLPRSAAKREQQPLARAAAEVQVLPQICRGHLVLPAPFAGPAAALNDPFLHTSRFGLPMGVMWALAWNCWQSRTVFLSRQARSTCVCAVCHLNIFSSCKTDSESGCQAAGKCSF